ncbi:MAG: hypothetical protein ACM3TN_12180 [Alphaproteobacteria bacterium]
MFARISYNRAREFVAHNFAAACSVHWAEAISVHEALQHLCKSELLTIEPDTPVGEMLPAPARVPSSLPRFAYINDPLDRIELAMAEEEEQGWMSDQEKDDFVRNFSMTEHVFNTLLGSVPSSWDPATIWARSIRTIVNERVRNRGGCTCD